jgi:hypothetical protein
MEQVIPIGRRQAYNLCQKYAKMAGIEQWRRAHPHRGKVVGHEDNASQNRTFEQFVLSHEELRL